MNARHADQIVKIVSGGQTGVDQGALDAAIWLGIAHGGWCPQGRRSEAGAIPKRYQLQQTESPNYAIRTEQNVIDSDGTLILYRDQISGGTAFTRRMARKHGKPWFAVNLSGVVEYGVVGEWLSSHQILVLNVAGPRESSHPGIGDEARQFVVDLLREAGAA